MADKEFSFDLKSLKELEKDLKNSKRKFVSAISGTLNNVAFEQRAEYIDQINDRMTVRNSKFVNSSIKVNKAKGRSIQALEAEVGSISRDRFSGWEEQEFGTKRNSSRSFTNFGRVSGSDQRQAKGKARAKANNKFAKISDYTIRATSRRHRLIIFLKMMAEKKKVFVMPRKYKGLKRGIYSANSRGLKRMQTFGSKKTKRQPWMSPVNDRLQQNKIDKAWKKTLKFMSKR